MTLQCELEKEALIDQFSKSLTSAHEIKVKDLESKIEELSNKKCEPVVIPMSSRPGEGEFPNDGVKIMIEMEKDGKYTIK